MELTIERDGGTVIARPNGRLEGLLGASEFQKALESSIRPADHALILDMEELTYISSAGLRAVAIMINRTKAADMGFVLCSLSKSVNNVITTSGFNRLVQVVDNLEEARWAVAA